MHGSGAIQLVTTWICLGAGFAWKTSSSFSPAQSWLHYRDEGEDIKRHVLEVFRNLQYAYRQLGDLKIPQLVGVRASDIAIFEKYIGVHEPTMREEDEGDVAGALNWITVIDSHLMMLDDEEKNTVKDELLSLPSHEQRGALDGLRRMSYDDRERCLWQYFTFGIWWPSFVAPPELLAYLRPLGSV